MSVIDDTLQRYQNMSAQAQMPTPGAYNPGTPMPNLLPPPPQIPPIYSFQTEPGMVMSAQAMAYQQIRQNYMSPATAFQAGGSFSNYPNPAQMTSPGMGAFRQAIMPAPPPMTMTPGVTGSFVNPYDAAVSGRMQTQFNMFGDPSKAASNWGSAQANAFGQKVGGIVGAGIGMVAGGPWGASTGYGLGDMFGGMLGDIPGVGWLASLPYRDAVQQMSRGTRLQAGTHGAISMGMGDMGLGGRGMNVQAGVGLGRQLQGFAEQSKGAFNINDMINLTSSAAENGLLSGATNTDQIFDSVKRLTGLVGKIAKLTGDPDFKNNIREIANLRNAGFDLSQIPTVMDSMNMSARMAGMTRGQVMQAGGLQGGAIFANAGLSSGLGQQFGAAQAANTVMSGGALSPLLTNLLGGSQGITQRGTELNAAFLSGAAKLMLPYLSNAGGTDLDPSRIQKMLGGDVGLQQMIGQGAGRMDASSLQNLLMNLPELQSKLGQEMGPWGTELAMLRMTQGVQQQVPGMSFEMAAAQMAGGDPLSGKMLAGEWRSPERLTRLKAQLANTRQREAFAARQETAEALAEPDRSFSEKMGITLGKLGVGSGAVSAWSGALAFAAGDTELDMRTGKFVDARSREKSRQEQKADEIAEEQQRKEDEALGIRRVYAPKWTLGAGEREAAKAMTAGGESRYPSAGYHGVTAELAKRMGFSSDFLSTSYGGIGAILRGEDPGGIQPNFERQAEEVRKRLTAEGQSLTEFEEIHKDPKKWEARQRKITGMLSDKQRATIRLVAIDEAKKAGVDGKGVTWTNLRTVLIRALGMSSSEFSSVERAIRDYAYDVIKSSGDKDVKRAYAFLQESVGGERYMHDIDALQEEVKERRSKGVRELREAGLSEGLSAGEAETALGKISDASPEVQAAAIIKLRADTGDAGAAEEWASIERGGKSKEVLDFLAGAGDSGVTLLKNAGNKLAGLGITSRGAVAKSMSEGIQGRGALGSMAYRAGMGPLMDRIKELESTADPSTIGAAGKQGKTSAQLAELIKALEPLSSTEKQAVGSKLLADGSAKFSTAVDKFDVVVTKMAKVQNVDLSGIPKSDTETDAKP